MSKIKGKRVTVPMFEIYDNPTIKISDAQKIRLGLKQKNVIIHNKPHVVVSHSEHPDEYKTFFNWAHVKLPPFRKVTMPMIRLSDITQRRFPIMDRYSTRQKNLIINNKPHIVNNSRPFVYIHSAPHFVGAFPARQDITVLKPDKPSTLKLGWTVTEKLGIGVINPRGIIKLGLNTRPDNLVHKNNRYAKSNGDPRVILNNPIFTSVSLVGFPTDPKARIISKWPKTVK